MSGPHTSELVFEVKEEPEGGYSAVCLTESIVTQGDTWEEFRPRCQLSGLYVREWELAGARAFLSAE